MAEALIKISLLLNDLPPHRRRRIHADAAARLGRIGASPAQIGHHLLEAGEPVAAVPHILQTSSPGDDRFRWRFWRLALSRRDDLAG
jgi:hypothetical protein